MIKRVCLQIANTLMALDRDFPWRILPACLISDDPSCPGWIQCRPCWNSRVYRLNGGYLCPAHDHSLEYQVDEVASLCSRRPVCKRDEGCFLREDQVDFLYFFILRDRTCEAGQLTHLHFLLYRLAQWQDSHHFVVKAGETSSQSCIISILSMFHQWQSRCLLELIFGRNHYWFTCHPTQRST
jgi:hypothetical protein